MFVFQPVANKSMVSSGHDLFEAVACRLWLPKRDAAFWAAAAMAFGVGFALSPTLPHRPEAAHPSAGTRGVRNLPQLD